MNWCKLIGHKFGGFYLKDDKGDYFDPIVFEVPYGDAIDVYKKCSRCGEIYGLVDTVILVYSIHYSRDILLYYDNDSLG